MQIGWGASLVHDSQSSTALTYLCIHEHQDYAKPDHAMNA